MTSSAYLSFYGKQSLDAITTEEMFLQYDPRLYSMQVMAHGAQTKTRKFFICRLIERP